jgi:hypothetical protein
MVDTLYGWKSTDNQANSRSDWELAKPYVYRLYYESDNIDYTF